MWLKPLMVPIATWLDDKLGNGKRRASKKWWFDHEIMGGVVKTPKGTNQRDIDPSRKLDPTKQKMAYYHASMMPPPDAPGPMPVDRKAAMAAKDLLETPEEARARLARHGAKPAHYEPTPPLGTDEGGREINPNPYDPNKGSEAVAKAVADKEKERTGAR